MMIGKISLQDMYKELNAKAELFESDLGDNLSCFGYNVNTAETFNTEISREFRGIVFNTVTQKIVSRPLHKFFNLGERAETSINSLPWSKIACVMNKRDGSMIHSVDMYNDQNAPGAYALKSKRSMVSDVAVEATKFVKKHRMMKDGIMYDAMIRMLVLRNQTVTFEWTSPESRIVLAYKEPELKVLHIRDNETGEYWDRGTIEGFCSSFNVPTVELCEFDLTGIDLANHLVHLAEVSDEDIEGWVIQFESGEMVKLKTQKYLKLHRAITFLRHRDVAQLVLDEKLDDLKSLLTAENVNLKEILEIEYRVLKDIRSVITNVNKLITESIGLTRKEFALKNKDHEFFGLAMSKFIGKEPDIKKYFENNILKKNYSLQTINLGSSITSNGDNDE